MRTESLQNGNLTKKYGHIARVCLCTEARLGRLDDLVRNSSKNVELIAVPWELGTHSLDLSGSAIRCPMMPIGRNLFYQHIFNFCCPSLFV